MLTAHHWHAGHVRAEGEFTPEPVGLEALAAYLKEHRGSIFYLLADTAEEGFQLEDLPYVQGGDRNALNKLNAAIGELKALAVQPLLQNAVNALRKQDHQRGGEWAIKALEQDERSGFGWYMLAPVSIFALKHGAKLRRAGWH